MAYVRTRLGRLYYTEHGKTREKGDPAIILLHGLLFDGGMWRGQVEPLSELGRVIVMDGPGHGKSEPAPRFVLEEHADALFDACGELGIRRAVFVGLSWGGMVSMRVALQHPEKVAAMAILDSNAEGEPLAKRIKNRAFIAMHRRVGFPYSLYLSDLAPQMFSSRTIAERPDLLESSYKKAMGFDRGGLCRAAIAVVIHRKNILPELSKLRAKTLVLCGTEDGATPPEKSMQIANAIPHAELVLLEGLGHMCAIEDPARVNEHLVPFVASAVGGGRG